MSKQRYYAVSTGRQTGIYTSWNEVHRQVSGFKNATQRGYPTLKEALQDMKVNGYENPPIFRHRDVSIKSTCSDTDLTATVTYADTLPEETPERVKIAEIDHPPIDIGQLFVNESQSCEEISFSIKHHETLPKTIETSAETILSSSDETRSSSTSSVLVSTNSHAQNSKTKDNAKIEDSLNSHQHQHCSCNELLNNQPLYALIDRLYNKIDDLEKSLSTQLQTNKDLIATIIRKQESQSQKQDDQTDSLNGLRNSIQQTKSETATKFELLDKKIDIIQENQLVQDKKQEHQLLATDDLIAISKGTQSDVLEMDTKLDITITDLKRHLENSQLKMNGKEKKGHDHVPYSTHASTLQSDLDIKTSSIIHHINGSPKPDTTSSSANDDTDKSDDEDMLAYHPLMATSMQDPRAQKKTSFHLTNQNSKNILLGDSNMKTINRTRLDRTKETDIRTYRGASIKSLSDNIASSQVTYTHIEKVSLCIGSIDCARRFIDEKHVIDDYDNLLTVVKKIFPSAQIIIISIPPQRNKKINTIIWKINSSLKSLAKSRNVSFSHCEALWMHVGPDGSIDNGLLVDNIHLSSRGVALLLRPIIAFFYSNRSTPQPKSEDQSGKERKAPSFTRATTESSSHVSDSTNQMQVLAENLAKTISKGFKSFTKKTLKLINNAPSYADVAAGH